MWNNWFLGYPKPTTRTYYTLGQILSAVKNQDWEEMVPYDDSIGVYGMIDDDYIAVMGKDTPQTVKLLQEYIWPQFWDAVITYSDEDLDKEGIIQLWKHKKSKIYRWINESSEVYAVLIANLEANKSKLLDAIKTSTNTRFNDTPQEPGVFTEDEYTSSITATESATDAGTLMSRLKEIEDDLRSLYGKWANEFSRFIIYSAI